jgi:hypothetical protein
MTSNRGRVAALVALALGAAACGEPAIARHLPVRFRATSDDGQPLAGVEIRAAGFVGATNSRGELLTELPGVEGASVDAKYSCPARFETRDGALAIKLAATRELSGGALQPATYEVRCTRRERDVVVIARADGYPGLGITIDGRTSGATDAFGVAHLLVPIDVSATSLRVGFATDDRAELLPKSPERSFELGQGDEILTFEQRFSEAQKASSPRRKTGKARHVPARIN